MKALQRLARFLEAEERPAFQLHRDRTLKGAHRQIVRISRARFRAQRSAVLTSDLRTHLGALKLAEADGKHDKELALALALNAVTPPINSVPLETDAINGFDGSLRAAIRSGAEAVQDFLKAPRLATDSFEAEYLKSNGFSRLTGELDRTSVNRLAGAIADAYDAGGSFDDVVRAIKGQFSDFSAVRARMIAQTELNDAFNQGVMHFGREAGAQGKSWQTDADPCDICIANAAQGIIPIEDDFLSGADAAPEHPNCQCSILVHALSE